MKHVVSLTVNNEPMALVVESHRSLLDALRDEGGLTGTKKGCNVGECGSCTVIMDGKPVNACLVLAVEAGGTVIRTIEGEQLGPDTPSLLQENFMACGATQCGYCTPGFIMAAQALLEENQSPTEEEINFAIAGNICRCTGYTKIVEAIALTAEQMRVQHSQEA